MTQPPIAVFAYAFAHRKTQDMLVELAMAGITQVCVLAAPWQELPNQDSTDYFPRRLRDAPVHETKTICKALAFKYIETRHDDTAQIEKLQKEYGFSIGVITGARILSGAVIELFRDGIVNFHPGKIPETSGLDLFFYSIKNSVALGVTAHFIDSKVDAGYFLFFEETFVGPEDSPEIVQRNNYQTQILALRKFLLLLKANALAPSPIFRPRKNAPMRADEKFRVLEEFSSWRALRVQEQSQSALFDACASGNVKSVENLLSEFPLLISAPTREGWSPLIVAAFNQQAGVVESLLDRGADPNSAGNNGTSVLMYAKTALLNQKDVSYTLLGTLLAAGAKLSSKDSMGKTVLDYVLEAKDMRMYAWLKSKADGDNS